MPALLALVAVTVVWGLTFVQVKDAVAVYALFPFLALRFLIAVAVLAPFGWSRLRGLGRSGVRAAALATTGPMDAALAAESMAVVASLAGALVGARDGGPAVAGVDRDHLPHADRALSVARRLADAAVAALPQDEAITQGR